MIDHVNYSKLVPKEKLEVPILPEKKSLLEDYNDTGNYIDENPNMISLCFPPPSFGYV